MVVEVDWPGEKEITVELHIYTRNTHKLKFACKHTHLCKRRRCFWFSARSIGTCFFLKHISSTECSLSP